MKNNEIEANLSGKWEIMSEIDELCKKNEGLEEDLGKG